MSYREPSVLSDVELIAQMEAGTAQALAELYDRHAGRVFGLLLRLVDRRDDAEDLLQETFAQAWSQAGRYQEERSTPLVWLLMIARSRALDFLRRRGVRSRPLVGCVVSQENAHAALEQAETAVAVRNALGHLPPPQREALQLAYYQGLTHHEIAGHLGISLGTAKSRIRLALEKLRDLLEGWEAVAAP